MSGSQAAVPATTYGSEAEPIEAVLVFSDPANWYVDLQLITDVISSGAPSVLDLPWLAAVLCHTSLWLHT